MWRCLALGNSWLRQTGPSGLCVMSLGSLIGHSNECVPKEKYWAIDSNRCQKSLMKRNKSLWNNSSGNCVYCSLLSLSQLLEPRSSKWGNGLRSGGGRSNKLTTWQRHPSTHFARGPDVFKEGTFLTSWEWDEGLFLFFLQPMSNTSIDFANERLRVFACTSVQADSPFWCLNSACFFPVELAKCRSLASEQNIPQLWSIPHCKLSSYTGHTLDTYQDAGDRRHNDSVNCFLNSIILTHESICPEPISAVVGNDDTADSADMRSQMIAQSVEIKYGRRCWCFPACTFLLTIAGLPSVQVESWMSNMFDIYDSCLKRLIATRTWANIWTSRRSGYAHHATFHPTYNCCRGRIRLKIGFNICVWPASVL